MAGKGIGSGGGFSQVFCSGNWRYVGDWQDKDKGNTTKQTPSSNQNWTRLFHFQNGNSRVLDEKRGKRTTFLTYCFIAKACFM
jgi:hypothetical protein